MKKIFIINLALIINNSFCSDRSARHERLLPAKAPELYETYKPAGQANKNDYTIEGKRVSYCEYYLNFKKPLYSLDAILGKYYINGRETSQKEYLAAKLAQDVFFLNTEEPNSETDAKKAVLLKTIETCIEKEKKTSCQIM
jgi:hypothetical protein